jgi:hypothetical protein
VSVGLKGETLVVVNKDQNPAQAGTVAGAILPNYTTFNVSPGGQLSPIPDSTVSVAYGSSPSQALIAAQGNVVFGADFLGGLLQSFSLRSERCAGPESSAGASQLDLRRPDGRPPAAGHVF